MTPRSIHLALAAALLAATAPLAFSQQGPLVVPADQAKELPAPPAKPAPAFDADRLDQLVAPIALYPDGLLMQVLIASTYPLEVVEADRWRRKNADLKDDALAKALAEKDWDPSVEGLTSFPDLLQRMSDNLDWTKDVGDAFLVQKDDVMDAVQRMRKRAQDAGNLATSKEQTITNEIVREKETIVIKPADPQVVYVPSYPPATAYGPTYAPPAPYYPTMQGYTPGQMATASLLSFGVGVGVGALISDGCDWGSNDVYVNNHYHGGGGGGGNQGGHNDVNLTVDKSTVNVRKSWQHDPEHRRNVDYRDGKTAQRYQTTPPAAQRQARAEARGFEPGAAERSGTAARRPSGDGERARPATAERAGTERARPSGAAGGRQGAFDYDKGGATRQASQRGATSRGSQSMAGTGSGRSERGGGGGERRGGGRRR